jgi:hypothetical protein
VTFRRDKADRCALLPRFLLFDVTGPKPSRVEPGVTVYDVPKSLVEAVQALALAGRGAGNLSNNDHGSSANKPTIVEYSEEAAIELARFEASVDEREDLATPASVPILNRAVEHAIKLALTVSVASDCVKPVITGRAMIWAVQLAWLSTGTMIEETRRQHCANLPMPRSLPALTCRRHRDSDYESSPATNRHRLHLRRRLRR